MNTEIVIQHLYHEIIIHNNKSLVMDHSFIVQ